MHSKTWRIIGELTQDDIEWILRSKLEFIPGEQHYVDVAMFAGGPPMRLPSRVDPAEITTNDPKEETWLKLYFGDRVYDINII